MDDEFLKRNTDCVYFLASPLTCKKGIECEYRHSDISRLNPRDCWYWLSGNCLNPACAFRHPPLDVHNEGSSETATGPPREVPTPVKTEVPCYFFFNGFCNKGEHCTFSHGLGDCTPARKPSIAISAFPVAPSTGTKASAGTETKATPIEKNPIQSETCLKTALKTEIKQNDIIQAPVPSKTVKGSASPERSLSECEETAVVGSESVPLAEGSLQIRSLICTDESSDEQADDHIEPEERWESSPGFDVIVDGRSDVMGYVDDPEYSLSLDRDGGELNGHMLGYDFKDQAEFDPFCSDAEMVFERGYKSYDCIDEHINDYGQIVRGHSMDRMLDPMLSQKRNLLPVELAENGSIGMDLRDRLRKRRGFDGYPLTLFSRRHDSSRSIARTHERSQRHNKGWRVRRRLTSEVAREAIGSLGEKEYIPSGVNRQYRFRHTRMSNRYRQHFEEKRQPKMQYFTSEFPRKPANRAGRCTQESSSFSGPKTLAEIKEEKKKGRENGVSFGIGMRSGTTVRADFQGPKPLSEILKEKQRLNSDGDISCN